MLRRANTAFCRNFANSRNLWQSIFPLLHGGGQGFESPRLHSIFAGIYRLNVDNARMLLLANQAIGSSTAAVEESRDTQCVSNMPYRGCSRRGHPPSLWPSGLRCQV